MRILDSIIFAIERGVQVIRAHVRADILKLEDRVDDIKRAIETDIFGPMTPDEVEAYLVACSQVAPDATDWGNSITDLLKILDLDASKEARRDLFVELDGVGDYTGTADQNIWLHDQVMDQVAHRLFKSVNA